MIRLKIKGKEYFPCRINNYNKYRAKLLSFIGKNPNLYFEGVKDIESGLFGILVKGNDVNNIRKIDLFYSLRDINFFFYKKQERESDLKNKFKR